MEAPDVPMADASAAVAAATAPQPQPQPQPGHGAGGETEAASADAGAGAVANAVPLHDQLSRSFSGDALEQLESLGVCAFDSAEVEANLLAAAGLTDGAKAQEDQAKRDDAISAAIAAATAKGAAGASAAPKRRIPKKSAAQLALESERASFVPLPAPRPRERIVHPEERRPPPASRQFRARKADVAAAAAAGSSRGGGLYRSAAAAASGAGESILDRVAAHSSSLLSEEGEAAFLARQKRIEAGEITPTIAGIGRARASPGAGADAALGDDAEEGEVVRVATRRIGPAVATAAGTMPLPPAAAAAAPASAHASAAGKKPRSSAKKTKSSRATDDSASPVPKRARGTQGKRGAKRQRRHKDSDSSLSSDAVSDSDSTAQGPRRKIGSKVKVKKEPRPWNCAVCTFLNPSDFSTRCGMCHTVRSKEDIEAAAAAAAAAAPAVKREPGVREYVSISDDAEGEDGGEAELFPDASASVSAADAKPKSKLRERTAKRKRPASSPAAADEEEEDEAGNARSEEEEEGEWAAPVDGSDSDTSAASSSDAEEIDLALGEEDELGDHDAGSDDSEGALEAAALRDSAPGASKTQRKRRHVVHDDYEKWRYRRRVEAYRAQKEAEEKFAAERAAAAAAEAAAAAPADDPAASAAAAAAARRGATESQMDVAFPGGEFILPGRIWNRLFPYQRTCVKWLWELHKQEVGCVLADEMGLGKTVQVCAFLAGLHYSAQHALADADADGGAAAAPESVASLGPTLIIVPATILTQWMRELHQWYPELRVFVLHDSVPHPPGTSKRHVVHECFSHSLAGKRGAPGHGSVLITTYQSMHASKALLLPREWGYVVLDEGHRIKSPDAAITLLCKQLLSVHRLLLTGSPIQNSLVELWSLFDFVFPGKLGTLPVFEDEFVSPIVQGGYTSASPVQIALAYKCALILRDLISPHLLRRLKSDVAAHLPPKTEQVLFCNLTPRQHEVYRAFLDEHAGDIREIVAGKLSIFRVIHFLRKICNHPDLLALKVGGDKASKRNGGGGGKGRDRGDRDMDRDRGRTSLREQERLSAHPLPEDYGAVSRSGKLAVLQQVLRMWKTQGHRALIFSQTRQMLDILESFVRGEGYSFRRVDGATPIGARIPLIDEYNHNESIFIMLLTTRAGGLGVNLTGADRVVLYDPDWNPSTDAQARERAYRIGQTRPTTVYRLITRGCIEEKVYHRQIWKAFLTDKVLKDPKQKRFFSNQDIKDLFSLAPLPGSAAAAAAAAKGKRGGAGGMGGGGGMSGTGSGSGSGSRTAPSETASIFAGSGGEIRVRDVMRAEAERRREEEEAAAAAAATAAADQHRHPDPYADDPYADAELEEGEVAAAAAPVSASASASTPVTAIKTEPRDSHTDERKDTHVAASASGPRRAGGVKTERSGGGGASSSSLPAPSDRDLPPDLDVAPYESDSEGAGGSTAAAAAAAQAHAQSSADDNRILAALFSGEGALQSAMDHDAILGAGAKSNDAAAVANLAARVAARAVAALKASRKAMADQPVNAPTWTGRSGTSGAPSFAATGVPPPLQHAAPNSSPTKPPQQAPPRFGATSHRPFSSSAASSSSSFLGAGAGSAAGGIGSSAAAVPTGRHFDSSVGGFALTGTAVAGGGFGTGSSSGPLSAPPGHGGATPSSALLERMRSRNRVSSAMASPDAVDDAAVGGGLASAASSSSSGAPDRSSLLLSQLRSVLHARSPSGGVSSDELIGLFSASIGSSDADRLVFRQMLRSIARLEGKKKNARWVLKEDFE